MQKVFQAWRDFSVAKKLYAVIGFMAVLIFAELLTLWFAMNALSSVRAFVGGEGMWSKAQKDAAFSLQRYAVTRDERDYLAFKENIAVCNGDRIARIELEKENPNLDIVRQGFLKGKNHPEDIEKMIQLIQRYGFITYVKEAVKTWEGADALLMQLDDVGTRYHAELNKPQQDPWALRELVARLQELNHGLTIHEDRFSSILAEGSRWLESLVMKILTFAVIAVESIGLSLAFITSRSISRSLKEITQTAKAIGHGDFGKQLTIKSKDEIGDLASCINIMGAMLNQSYTELENRVKERTAELAKAIAVRDEFLSIASHELKTPLTILSLQTQLRQKLMESHNPEHFTMEKIEKMIESDSRQVEKLTRLIDDMLDISRLSMKKLDLKMDPVDLGRLTQEVCDRFAVNLKNNACDLTLQIEPHVVVMGDRNRLEQIIENLLTNAIKYAACKPIFISVQAEGSLAKFKIKDSGIGIAEKDYERIFLQFERAVSGSQIAGLGLGLYISKQIALMHHGNLEVESELGKGSTFTLTLNLIEAR